MSGSADIPDFPWLYPYQEDGPRLDHIVHRPIVSVALVGPSGEASSGLYAMVDSGCHHILVAPWLGLTIGVDPKASAREIDLGIGGSTQKVRFADVAVRLLAPGGTDEQFHEWETEVGFIDAWKPTFPVLLGQHGFLDKFTVTMSNHARMTAVEPVEAFDTRFGIPPVQKWWPGQH